MGTKTEREGMARTKRQEVPVGVGAGGDRGGVGTRGRGKSETWCRSVSPRQGL